MKKLFCISAIIAVGMIMSAFTSIPTHGNHDDFGVVYNESYPIVGVFIGCGIEVRVEGFAHELITETITNNGHYLYKFHINAKGKGIGVDEEGNEYKYEWNHLRNYVFTMLPGSSDTYTERLRIIGQGSAPEFFLDVTNHITVNANGVLVVERSEYAMGCK